MFNGDVKEDYYSDYIKKDNQIVFSDKKNTLKIIIDEDCLVFTKNGEVNMVQKFKLNTYIEGNYEVMGLSINIASYTKKIKLNEKGLFIEYDHYLDNQINSVAKIYIKFTE